MDFSKYQQILNALEQERGWDRVLPSHTFLHMGEELGEIGRVLQCLEGYRGTTQNREALCADLAGELADLTAFIFKLANQHGVDMDATMRQHLEKFIGRYPNIEEGRREMARYVAQQERNMEWIKGKNKIKVLVLCDDRWHPARIPRAGLAALKTNEFTFDWVEDVRDWSPECLSAYPLVILTKSNNISASDESEWMTEAIEATLADYVRQGNGLLAVHSGAAGYAQTPTLRALLGGLFDHHPEQCPVTVIPQAGHPLCAGCEPFTLKDEHYFMAMNAPDVEVFVTTQSEHGAQPGAWTRTEGAGRVAMVTPGHTLEVWRHPSFQTLLLNLMRWCCQR